MTGSAAGDTMSSSLPELCARVRKYAGRIPIAVGFGVNTREHFLSVGNHADGVVIGSKIVTLIKEATPGTAEGIVRAYCKEVSRPRTQQEQSALPEVNGLARVNAKSMTTVVPGQEKDAECLLGELGTLTEMSVNESEKREVYSGKIGLM